MVTWGCLPRLLVLLNPGWMWNRKFSKFQKICVGCLNHPVRCVPQGYHRLKNRTVQASPLLHSPLCLLSHRRCLLASCILLLSSTSPPPLTFSHPANSTLTATSVPPPHYPFCLLSHRYTPCVYFANSAFPCILLLLSTSPPFRTLYFLLSQCTSPSGTAETIDAIDDWLLFDNSWQSWL